MRYFKDEVGEVYGYTQEQIDQGHASSQLVEMTPEELTRHCHIDINATISPVTPRQIRQALTALGLRGQVESLVAAGSQDLKDWWEFSEKFEIDHPAVIQMAQAIGVGQSKLVELFQLASSL